MDTTLNPSAHFSLCGDRQIQFTDAAQEVRILDRRGEIVWTKSREGEEAPIRWEGTEPLSTGDYICKIIYAGAKIAYLPIFCAQK